MVQKNFTFIGGADDFLVNRLAKSRFEEMGEGLTDEFSRDMVDGFANTVADVESAVNQFQTTVETMPMFGERKVVWFRNVSFLADSVTGRAEGTLAQVQRLRDLLEEIDPAATAVLLTASPVDRRRTFPKWCEGNAEYHWVGGGGKGGSGDSENLEELVRTECREQKVSIEKDAMGLLLGKLNGNTRLIVEEVRKLAAYLGQDDAVIESAHVTELVPHFGEGDVFEAAEAFFSGDLVWTLDALHRHFFSGHDARPLIAMMQNRNRILIQLRILIDSGEIRLGYRGLDKAGFERAAAAYADVFGEGKDKSPFNVFSQNLWYLGRLAEGLKSSPLKRLITFQSEFLRAFTEIIERPNQEEDVLKEMAIRCLGR